MKAYLTDFKGVIVLEQEKFNDDRGSFSEVWNHKVFRKYCQLSFDEFVQENESVSKAGVARGMHWQIPPFDQAKLVRCTYGRILDIVYDIMPDSPSYGNFLVVELTPEYGNMIYIPRGYAHGFIALEDNTVVNYKVDNYYSKEHERSFNLKDIDLTKVGINTELKEKLILSEKDSAAPAFNDLSSDDLLPYFNFDYDVMVEDTPKVTEETFELKHDDEDHTFVIEQEDEHPAYDNAQDSPEYVNVSIDELKPASEVQAESIEKTEEVKEENKTEDTIKQLGDGSFFIPFSQGKQAMQQFAAMGFPVNLEKPEEDVETNSYSN